MLWGSPSSVMVKSFAVNPSTGRPSLPTTLTASTISRVVLRNVGAVWDGDWAAFTVTAPHKVTNSPARHARHLFSGVRVLLIASTGKSFEACAWYSCGWETRTGDCRRAYSRRRRSPDSVRWWHRFASRG